jgi:5-methyltetrahydropteroyltriglutamate--homocysteine methyltransferase
MLASAADGTADAELVSKSVEAAVADAVGRQLEAGIDVVSDGEMGTVSFMDAASRLTGFDGPMAPYVPADVVAARVVPAFAQRFMAEGDRLLPSNTSKDITYLSGPVRAAIDRFSRVLASYPQVQGAFLPAPSPGTLARLGTSAFKRYEDFLLAIAAAMREEYRLITDAGFDVQVDCPDLAMCKHTDYNHLTVEAFLDIARLNVEALNWALEGIDPRKVRLHVCWGNYRGPHHLDLPLEHIIEILYTARVGTLVIEQSNPRHRDEWATLQRNPLSEAETTVSTLAVGVVSTTIPHVEKPLVVAEDLIRLAGAVGKDRLMATTDCGFATFAEVPAAESAEVAYLKLASLAEGARIASNWLWA